MAKKRKRRIFLETSGVFYQLHGHSLMRQAVAVATRDGRIEVSTFIRMEYLRGVVLNLIELYFLMKGSDSVADALSDWSQKVWQERKLKVVLMTIPHWLCDQQDPHAKHKSLRRLGDLILRLVDEFDERFRRRTKDHLQCRLGRLRFPPRSFDEDLLLTFYDRFKSIRDNPRCGLCRFRDRRKRSLAARRIDLWSPERRNEFQQYPGYVKQAERLEKAAETSQTIPKCSWCERLGDSIIALQAPPKAILVTADRAFVAFGQILGQKVRLLPSLAQLKAQLTQRVERSE